MPEISLIVPLYNAGRHLRACLDSVLGQTFQNMEVLLINDGSTDETEQVAQEYCAKDARLRLINQANGGVSAARNRGMREAGAPYIAFLDQDDVLHPQAMEILHGLMEKYQTDEVAFKIEFVPDSFVAPATFEQYDVEQVTKNARLVESPMKDFFANYKGGQIYVWNKLYKLSAIKGIEFPLTVQPAEDTVFTLKTLLTIKNIVFTDAKLLFYRKNDDSVSKQGITEKYVRSHAVAAKEMENFFKPFAQDRWLAPHLDFYLSRFIFKSLVSQPLRLILGENRRERVERARQYAFELYQSGALKPNLLGFRKNLACKMFFKKHDKLAKFLV